MIKPAAATKSSPIAAHPQVVGHQPPSLLATRPTETAHRSAGAIWAGRTRSITHIEREGPPGGGPLACFGHVQCLTGVSDTGRGRQSPSGLLELDARPCLLELRLDRVGLFLVHALLHGRRGAVDEVLGLL